MPADTGVRSRHWIEPSAAAKARPRSAVTSGPDTESGRPLPDSEQPTPKPDAPSEPPDAA
jgi:hypothetical protein